jgi:hypothetical protein
MTARRQPEAVRASMQGPLKLTAGRCDRGEGPIYRNFAGRPLPDSGRERPRMRVGIRACNRSAWPIRASPLAGISKLRVVYGGEKVLQLTCAAETGARSSGVGRARRPRPGPGGTAGRRRVRGDLVPVTGSSACATLATDAGQGSVPGHAVIALPLPARAQAAAGTARRAHSWNPAGGRPRTVWTPSLR